MMTSAYRSTFYLVYGVPPAYLDLSRDDPVQVDRRGRGRSSLALGQLLLLHLPLLDAAGDVDGDAPAAKVPPTDVAGDGHAGGLKGTVPQD